MSQPTSPTAPSPDVERSVRDRYSSAANERESALCCPVDYRTEFLEVIPEEILERDYGCGDPSRYVREGETVLDLGSGGGKICYIASQVVGPQGRVIGVDMNDDMLELAEQYREKVGERIGHHNVEFLKGKIQDLALDVRALEQRLEQTPPSTFAELEALDRWTVQQRAERPLVESDSVDVVVSNCVLNLVRHEDRVALFSEIFRVLKRGGRAVISDIVCDESVPVEMQNDPTLWSGCISGAFEEHEFLQAFEDAGFYGVQLVKRDEQPWQTVEGIEFRSVTVEAYKGKEGVCLERNQAVIYRGPWSEVHDDDGHTFVRGQRTAVCHKSYQILTRAPYADQLIGIEPYNEVPLDAAEEFSSCRPRVRDAKESKGADYRTTESSEGGCC